MSTHIFVSALYWSPDILTSKVAVNLSIFITRVCRLCWLLRVWTNLNFVSLNWEIIIFSSLHVNPIFNSAGLSGERWYSKYFYYFFNCIKLIYWLIKNGMLRFSQDNFFVVLICCIIWLIKYKLAYLTKVYWFKCASF